VTKIRIGAGVFAAVAVAAVVGGSALAGTVTAPKPKTVAFKGSYAGTATTKQNGSVMDIAAKGTGTATLIGKSKLAGTGKGQSSDQACVPFSGPATLTATNGAKLKFSVLPTSTGCGDQDETVPVNVTGYAKFKGGTGKFVKAKGTFKFTGVYNRGTGAFTVKFTGKLTV
jgi:hypothetical protein